jgi:hypothetical protein
MVILLTVVAWIACAIVAFSNHTFLTLLCWSIPIPVIMVPLLFWMRWNYSDRWRVFTLPKLHGSPHLSRHQRQAALQPLPPATAAVLTGY